MEQRKLSPTAARSNPIKQKNAEAIRWDNNKATFRGKIGKKTPPIGKAQKMAMLYKVRLDEISFT